jgi:hypothetical protein
MLEHVTFGFRNVETGEFEDPWVSWVEMDAGVGTAVGGLQDAILVPGKRSIR